MTKQEYRDDLRKKLSKMDTQQLRKYAKEHKIAVSSSSQDRLIDAIVATSTVRENIAGAFSQ